MDRGAAARGPDYLVLSLPEEGFDGMIGTFSNVWFDCDDLDRTYEELSSEGIEFPVPPAEAPWDPSSRWAQFADPDGTTYGLSQRD